MNIPTPVEREKISKLTIDDIISEPDFKKVFDSYPANLQKQMKELKPYTLLLNLQIAKECSEVDYLMKNKMIGNREFRQRMIHIDTMKLDAAMYEHSDILQDYTFDILLANKLAYYMLGMLPEQLRELGFFEKYFNREIKMAWKQLYKISDLKEDFWEVNIETTVEKLQNWSPRLIQEFKGYITNLYGWLFRDLTDKHVASNPTDTAIIARIESCVLMVMYANDIYIGRTEALAELSVMFVNHMDYLSISKVGSKAGNLCKAICHRLGKTNGIIKLDENPEFVKICQDLDNKFNDKETRERIFTRKAV